MQILQGSNFRSLLEQGTNSPYRGIGRGKRGDARDIVANGRAPNRFLVIERLAAQGRVYDQIDFAGFHQVHNIRPALIDLEHGFGLDSRSFESRSGSAGGKQMKTKRGELFAERTDVPFV